MQWVGGARVVRVDDHRTQRKVSKTLTIQQTIQTQELIITSRIFIFEFKNTLLNLPWSLQDFCLAVNRTDTLHNKSAKVTKC